MMLFIQWIKNKLRCRKYKKFIQYYKSNPDKFCEDFLRIELFEYQKEMLRETIEE